MNSREWLNNDIDELFKTSAKSYSPSFDPKAWEKMEEKIIGYQQMKSWYNGTLGGTMTVLLVLFLMTGMNYGSGPGMTSNDQVPGSAVAEAKEQPADREEIPVISNPGEKGAEMDYEETIKPFTPSSDSDNPVISANDNVQTASVPAAASVNKEHSMAFAPGLMTSQGKDIRFKAPVALNPGPVEVLSGSDPEEVIPETASFPRWGIGVMYAPDLSSVGLKNFTSPGTNLGLSIEYRVTPRVSVSSGMIYGIKKYDTEGDEYTVPPGFWYGYRTPEMIHAQCDVIDIPVNISWVFYQGSKSAFSVSTGLSSYIMLSEDYTYEGTYTNNGGSWSIKNENRHFFGIYNISLAYTRPLSERLHLQVEPFMKIPMTDIGFGQVDLNSTGLMLSLKYWMKNKR